MDQRQNTSSINQIIFKLNLGVDATSLYLLCCGIADTGEVISYPDILSKWNGDTDSLKKSLETLEQLQIILGHGAPAIDNETYELLPVEKWKI